MNYVDLKAILVAIQNFGLPFFFICAGGIGLGAFASSLFNAPTYPADYDYTFLFPPSDEKDDQ